MIQKYVILKAVTLLAEERVQLSAAEIDRIIELMHRGCTGSYLEFAANIKIVCDRRCLIFSNDTASHLHYKLSPGKDQDIPEIAVRAVWGKPDPEHLLIGDGLAADMAIGSGASKLTLRYAQEADRFFALGSPGEKRLFRFLMDRKVSRFEKRTTPVLVKNGEIIWVVGHRISEKVRVCEQSDENWHLRLVPFADKRTLESH